MRIARERTLRNGPKAVDVAAKAGGHGADGVRPVEHHVGEGVAGAFAVGAALAPYFLAKSVDVALLQADETVPVLEVGRVLGCQMLRGGVELHRHAAGLRIAIVKHLSKAVARTNGPGCRVSGWMVR